MNELIPINYDNEEIKSAKILLEEKIEARHLFVLNKKINTK